MAGKNTSKDLHNSKTGHMVQQINIGSRDWETLEELAGCKFSPAQRDEIDNELTVCRDYCAYLAEMVSRQDVKRTLGAISRLQGSELIEAYNNCDQITDVLIYEAAWFQFGVNVLTCTDDNLTCETIAKAAAFVLDTLPDSMGGRPQKGHHKRLARFCCKLWEDAGNHHSANTWDSKPSPMVELAQFIFDLVDDHLTDPNSIAERLNAAR